MNPTLIESKCIILYSQIIDLPLTSIYMYLTSNLYSIFIRFKSAYICTYIYLYQDLKKEKSLMLSILHCVALFVIIKYV